MKSCIGCLPGLTNAGDNLLTSLQETRARSNYGTTGTGRKTTKAEDKETGCIRSEVCSTLWEIRNSVE
jgi:hypothetical protein